MFIPTQLSIHPITHIENRRVKNWMASQFVSSNDRRLFRGWRICWRWGRWLLKFTPPTVTRNHLLHAEFKYHSLAFERGFRERYEQRVTSLTSAIRYPGPAIVCENSLYSY